jgi:hypothetical protein
MIITSSVMNSAECWVQSTNKNIKWHSGADWSVFEFTLHPSSYIRVYCYFSRKFSHRLNLRTELCPLNMRTSRIYVYPHHVQDFSGRNHGLVTFGAFLSSGKFWDSAIKWRRSNCSTALLVHSSSFHSKIYISIYLCNCLSLCLSIYLSMALQPLWTFAAFSVF